MEERKISTDPPENAAHAQVISDFVESEAYLDMQHPRMRAAVARIPSFGSGACHRIILELAEALASFEPRARWRAVLGEVPGVERPKIPHSWLTVDKWTLDPTPFDGSPEGSLDLTSAARKMKPKLTLKVDGYLALSSIPPLLDDPALPRRLSIKVRKWLREAAVITEEFDQGFFREAI